MRLLIDLDGVCADFYKRLIYWYNRDFDDDMTADRLKSWVINEDNFPKAPREKMRAYFNVPNFWLNLEPIHGCQESLLRLHQQGHELVVVTATPEESERAFWEKGAWVDKYLPFIGRRNFVSTWRKDLVRGDLLLDDGPHNLSAFPGLTCAMDASYNREVESDYRVYSWSDFEEVICEITDARFCRE